MINTDIIVVLYGDRGDLDRLKDSIQENCKDFNLIIIDNNPPNDNLGFTKANNEGIKRGSAPWVWLINQDAIVLPGAQEALIERFSYHPKVGLVGSMQRDYKDPDIIRHGGTIKAFPGGIHDGGRISAGHCQIPKKQTWVNFASIMLRRSMIDEIGLLDEAMFLVYSDSDYCYMARKVGWECWYEPKSQVFHRLKSSRNVSDWHKKDMEAFMKKWGILYDEKTQKFQYSPEFQKLDMFP